MNVLFGRNNAGKSNLLNARALAIDPENVCVPDRDHTAHSGLPFHASSSSSSCPGPDMVIVRELMLDPVAEVDVPQVFAFGAAWFDVPACLVLPAVASQEANRGTGRRSSSDGASESSSRVRHQLVVTSQPGTGARPSQGEAEALRAVLGALS